jgi:hypothetical protein
MTAARVRKQQGHRGGTMSKVQIQAISIGKSEAHRQATVKERRKALHDLSRSYREKGWSPLGVQSYRPQKRWATPFGFRQRQRTCIIV